MSQVIFFIFFIKLFRAIKQDNMFFDILPIYCVCLYELNKLGELYQCAHKLVENYPKKSLSWFAVGVYYYLIKKYETSRKYF